MAEEKVYNSLLTGEQIDNALVAVRTKESIWDAKQDKLNGVSGQLVGFSEDGNAIPVDYKFDYDFASDDDIKSLLDD